MHGICMYLYNMKNNFANVKDHQLTQQQFSVISAPNKRMVSMQKIKDFSIHDLLIELVSRHHKNYKLIWCSKGSCDVKQLESINDKPQQQQSDSTSTLILWNRENILKNILSVK